MLQIFNTPEDLIQAISRVPTPNAEARAHKNRLMVLAPLTFEFKKILIDKGGIGNNKSFNRFTDILQENGLQDYTEKLEKAYNDIESWCDRMLQGGALEELVQETKAGMSKAERQVAFNEYVHKFGSKYESLFDLVIISTEETLAGVKKLSLKLRGEDKTIINKGVEVVTSEVQRLQDLSKGFKEYYQTMCKLAVMVQ